MNKLYEKLRSGGVALGLANGYPAQGIAESMSQGWDFLWIDNQHGQFDFKDVLSQVIATRASGSSALIRVPDFEASTLCRFADIAPEAIMAPMVNTKRDAQELVDGIYYPPMGKRSYGGRRVIDLYSRDGALEHKIMVVAQIETMEALENVDEIIGVDGIDAIFFGPDDVKLRQGIPIGNSISSSTLLIKITEKVGAAAKKAGKLAGIPVGSADECELLIKAGYRFFAAGGDVAFIRAGAAAKKAEFSKVMSQNEQIKCDKIKDVVFGTVNNMPLKLDIGYIKTDKKMPVVIYIHGGGWKTGSYHMESNERIKPLIRNGFFVICITYRKSFEAIFPAQLEDCKTAVRWVRAHADKYNIDSDRIGVYGYSAGGHLSALVGTSAGAPGFSEEGGWAGFPDNVQAVVAGCPPVDFNCQTHMLDDPDSAVCSLVGGLIKDKQGLVRAANPITYISDKTPPFLLLHGDKDPTVLIKNSELLYDALQEKGIESTFVTVKNAQHGFRMEGITPTLPEIEEMVLNFFKKHLTE